MKASAIMAIFIVAFSTAYYFVIYLPHQQDLKNQAAAQNARDLQNCLNQADTDGLTLWNDMCQTDATNGFRLEQATVPGKNCKLPVWSTGGIVDVNYWTDKTELIPEVNNSINNAKDLCFKKYPQN